ncbi:MAG: type III pantothenate kinase [Candidatus Hydrogenedentales bacterium]|jgi:type III pantothenate kinase
MLFVVDIGNSHTVLGLYKEKELLGQWRVFTSNYRTGDELSILLTMLLQSIQVNQQEITGCCVSSVVPPLNGAIQYVCKRAFGIEALMVEPGVKTGVMLQCENPREVGADRIANAVGALEEYPGPLIVIDFGTAITFDVITERMEWLGGVIAPGIQLSADSLFERCARLPRVDIVAPKEVIGRNTVTNIQAGLTYGYADMVDGIVGRICKELGRDAKVIATGGYARRISSVSKRIDLVDPLLTLKGLRAIYERNLGKGS